MPPERHGRLAGKVPQGTEYAGSREVRGFAARQHGNPSTVSAHREKLEAHELSQWCLLRYKLASVVPVFEGCFRVNLIKEPTWD